MSSRVKRLGRTTSLTLVAVMVAATGGLSGAGTAGAAVPAAVPNGGMLNVLDVGTQWPNIDVAADTQDAADSDFMNAIYGQLFELAPGNKVVPDEATGYHFSNNYQTVTINIRHGLKFSNGDPFTAANVAWSINRDLEPQWGNIGDANFPLQGPVVASGPYTITANMKHPDSAIIDAFIGEAPNWTADQKALTSMGEKAYEQKPIGAGPFEVVSNAASSKLVLKKNPNYWGASKGLPHLSGITFTAVGADQSAASALEQGTDQMAQLISTIPLLQSLPSKGLRVTQPPSTFTQFIALNEGNAPFDNIKAREAVAYATDAAALTKNLYHGAFPIVEDMSGPGQEFYQQKDKYFPAYDLAKAKALVQQLGGLSVNLSTTTNTAYWTTEVEALSTMWEAAGIKVNQQDNTLQQMLAITFNHTWQAIDSNWGNLDPSISDPEFFESNGPFSGVKDPTLDKLFAESASTASKSARAKIFKEINNREDQNVDAVWLYSKPFFDVSTKALIPNGGLGNNLGTVRWEDLALKNA
ncbi:MAG: ABC transporter substrate-binding protein [Acidimicrobiaceae bacterium]|nr:ABC transporter substrate-binding protein [Acidimicrobiaceae bacterium]